LCVVPPFSLVWYRLYGSHVHLLLNCALNLSRVSRGVSAGRGRCASRPLGVIGYDFPARESLQFPSCPYLSHLTYHIRISPRPISAGGSFPRPLGVCLGVPRDMVPLLSPPDYISAPSLPLPFLHIKPNFFIWNLPLDSMGAPEFVFGCAGLSFCPAMLLSYFFPSCP